MNGKDRIGFRIIYAAAAVGLLAMLTACDGESTASRPDIPFAPTEDKSLKDPDNPTKVFRVDFATVERTVPLSLNHRATLTPANMKTLSQEEIDQVYGRLTAGPIPDGPYQGDLFFAKGDSLKSRFEEILGGIKGRIAGKKIERVEKLGRILWKGKLFYRNERVLRNFIEDLLILKPIVGDSPGLQKATVPRRSLLRFVSPKTDVWLLFPAKLYCGQSLLDGRRESVIVDYFYTDEIKGYRPSPDSLAGRNGLKIRDEIRMVRPGFYLGRAYVDRAFLLNFTLYNPDVAEAGGTAFQEGKKVEEDCWAGEQARQLAAQ